MSSTNGGLMNSRWAPGSDQQAPRYLLATSTLYHNNPRHQAPRFNMDTPHNHYNLDPSVPTFQPSGKELQRYQAPTASSPPLVSPPTPRDMAHLQHYVLNNHFAHTKAVASLERQNQKTFAEIENVKEIVGRDVRSLEDEIAMLRLEVAAQQERSGLNNRASYAREMDKSNRVNIDKIAETYLEEAEDLEKTAEMLRQQVNKISTVAATMRLVRLRYSETPEVDTELVETVAKTEHACCGHVFASIGEMLDHVGESHGLRYQADHHVVLSVGEDEQDTPTHMPPRRAKVQKNGISPEIAPSDETVASTASAKEDKAVKSVHVPIHNEDATGSNFAADTSKHLEETQNSQEVLGWVPLAVRNMAPPTQIYGDSNTETFTWEFLVQTFGGKQWSPSYYFIPHESDLPSKSYWILDADYEPFLPSYPGQHGAKLTAFFNDTSTGPSEAPLEENFHSVPIFVRGKGEHTYVYFGQYSQMRFSDKLSHDEIMEKVPENVKRYWTTQLADKGRPIWVTEALMQHFWPKPAYEGPVPTESFFNSAESTTVGREDSKLKRTKSTKPKKIERSALPLEKPLARALVQYAEELREWRKDAEIKVNLLSADALMKAFEAADADVEPGMRLWWEYLECVGYDQGFYDYLVAIKKKPGLRGEAVAVRASKGSKGKVVKKRADPGPDGVETVRATMPTTGPSSDLSQGVPSKTKAHTKAAKHSKQDTPKPNGSPDVSKPARETEPIASGDLELAKHMHNNFTKAKPNERGGAGNNTRPSMPPHLRVRK